MLSTHLISQIFNAETQPENLSAKQNLKKILELQKESEAKIAEKKFSVIIENLNAKQN
jgi:hypothetical protein